ncbi:MAG: DUF1326 domain-containing protein [Alphaproteobacteria bacterium]
MTWSLKGTYFESCNCDAACPCVFLSAPTDGDCTVLIGWHIDQGHDGDVSLDGLNVALAVHSPGHMMETQWTAAAYVDARATEDQKNALLKIFGGQDGGHPARLAGHIGELVGAAQAAIDFHIEDGKYRLKIADIADMEIEQLPGQGEGPITITGHPLCIAPGFPATLAKSTRLTYADHGMAWELSGKNGFFSPFAYAN